MTGNDYTYIAVDGTSIQPYATLTSDGQVRKSDIAINNYIVV